MTIPSSINCYSACYGNGTIVAVGSITANVVYGTMEKENLTKSEIFDFIYPIGTVYYLTTTSKPAEIFVFGTWELFDTYTTDASTHSITTTVYYWKRTA